MAIRHVREAFNQEAGDAFTCQQATLGYTYDPATKKQMQVIRVVGIHADGTPFEVSTPEHAMNEDAHHHARLLARSIKEGLASKEAAAPEGAEATKAADPAIEVRIDPHLDGIPGLAGEGAPGDKFPNPFTRR